MVLQAFIQNTNTSFLKEELVICLYELYYPHYSVTDRIQTAKKDHVLKKISS